MKTATIVEKVLNGADVRKVLVEDAENDYVADTDYAERMVRAWLDHGSEPYTIEDVEVIGNDEVKVTFREGWSAPEYLIVTNDGLFNSNGDDVAEISLVAYSYNPAEVKWTEDFMSRWY